MNKEYDIIVLGAGSAGLNIASFMNSLGLKVLLVEKHIVGGDCLNYGCVPSKALISMAHTAAQARNASRLGLRIEGDINMETVAQTIAARQEVIREHENPAYFRRKGIDVETGVPRFISGNCIMVYDNLYRAPRIVIATGSRPAVPAIEGLDRVNYFTNETIFANRRLPRTLLVIGSGPIGIELAQAYQRLGSQVIMPVRSGRILKKEDPDISEALQQVLEKEGVDFRMGMQPVRFADANALTVTPFAASGKTAREETIRFDSVLVAAGRIPNIDGLDLENAGIEIKDGKILLDNYLRTTNKQVYCCGDAAGDYLFTHWAEHQAALIIRNMLSPFKKTADRSKIAWVTYTDPEIATFGPRSRQLTEQGIAHRTLTVPLGEVDRAICEGIEDGLLKLHLSRGKILGGTLMAKNAGEMAGELISFMTLGIPFNRLYKRIYPYPTMARILRRGVQKHLGEKLTPRSARILKRLYRFFNN
jgi:pyruvate/2-oxoglutarate dehydrogenase complex dihydrolipoamide dehydrogenase (E3) component